MDERFIPDFYQNPVIVLGCGNILFGDDGFGPSVVEFITNNYLIPENVSVINAGTSVREILFNIVLNKQRPEKIIIVDAIDAGRQPGEIFELSVDEIPENKIDDFSFHQLPTSNLLKELKQHCNVEVIIISAQVKNIPQEICPGLSKSLIDAIPKACEIVLHMTGTTK
jgi:coenzyme F420 hydrogenase subunit delta